LIGVIVPATYGPIGGRLTLLLTLIAVDRLRNQAYREGRVNWKGSSSASFSTADSYIWVRRCCFIAS